MATRLVAQGSHHHLALLRCAGIPRWMGVEMFKVIGGVVVYGFALFGVAKYLETLHDNLRED